MPTKITVNGVEYDSVDAMPADVRRTYEDTMAKFADLALGDGESAPKVVEGTFGPVHYTTTVRKKIVVNGTTYDDEASMPADVRQTFQQSMKMAQTGDPTVKKNVIHMSFQVTGPGFHVSKALGEGSTQPNAMSKPSPIEPAPGESGLRMILFVAGCAVIGLFLWLFLRVR